MALDSGNRCEGVQSPIVPLSRVSAGDIPDEARTVPSSKGWAKSALEGPIKSKEDLDNLADGSAEDVTRTVSPRAAKEGRYRAQSLDKYIPPELHHVTQSLEGTVAKDHSRILHEEGQAL
jgi:hypothetical protein